MQTNYPFCFIKNPQTTQVQGPYTVEQLYVYINDKKLPAQFLVSTDKKNWFIVAQVFASKESLRRFFEAERPTLFTKSEMEIMVSPVSQKPQEKNGMESLGSLFEESVDDVMEKANDSSTNAFAGYDIIGELGRGGMGIVYKVQNIQMKKVFALKVLISEDYSESDKKRFLREVELTSKLDHPNIVKVFHANVEPQPHMVMEYVEGQTLADLLRQKKGKMRPLEATRLIQVIATTISYAHDHNVIHRDIKPGNILIRTDGSPKIMDFGLAKNFDFGDKESSLSLKGEIIGTPQYMSPEQAAAKGEVDFRTDIYSIGVMYYQMLCGEPPFYEENTLSLLFQVIRGTVPPLKEKVADLPVEIELICLKCLEKNPDDRYSSAKKLADDLAKYLKGRPISLEKPTKWSVAKTQFKEHSIKVVLMVLTLFVVYVIYSFYQNAKLSKSAQVYQSAMSNFHNKEFDTFANEIKNASANEIKNAREIYDRKYRYAWMENIGKLLGNPTKSELEKMDYAFAEIAKNIPRKQEIEQYKLLLLRATCAYHMGDDKGKEKAKEYLKEVKIKHLSNKSIKKYDSLNFRTPFYKDPETTIEQAKYYALLAFLPEEERKDAFERLYYAREKIPSEEESLQQKYSHIEYLLSEEKDTWVNELLLQAVPSFLEMQEIVHKVESEWVCDMRSPYWSYLPVDIQGKYASLYQKAYAKQMGEDISKKEEPIPGVFFEFSLIPPGYFRIGDPYSIFDDGPAFETYILKAFWMMSNEVNQEQWQKVQLRNNKTKEDPRAITPWKGNKEDANTIEENILSPAVNFLWSHLNIFRNSLEKYDLPNEIEWEYSCRAGTLSKWFFLANSTPISSYDKHIYYKGSKSTKIISFRTSSDGNSNHWGLFGVYGNVAEVCSNEIFDYKSPEIKRIQPEEENMKISIVFRGGHLFSDSIDFCSSQSRKSITLDQFQNRARYVLGIRLKMEE